MLNIIQCKSDLEASQSQSQLNFQVEKLLSNNEELCKRLRNLEDTFDARNTLTRRLEDASIYEDNEEADSQTITTRRPMTERLGGPVMQTDIIRFAFESDLETSRVYRNAQSSHCDASFASSVARTNAWSIFSGLSLADVSVISVIALPVYSVDIENRQWYTFGDVDKVSDSLAPVAVTMPLEKLLQAAATSDKEKSEVDLDQRPLEERKNTVSHESVLIHENDLYPCSSCGDIMRKAESLEHAGKRWHIDCFRKLNHEDDDVQYLPCQGYEEILVEGKAYELAGRRWHIDCFRCKTCGSLLDSDSTLLLLGDGSLICNNCTYSYNHCGNKLRIGQFSLRIWHSVPVASAVGIANTRSKSRAMREHPKAFSACRAMSI